jgi:hypothetical protein
MGDHGNLDASVGKCPVWWRFDRLPDLELTES